MKNKHDGKICIDMYWLYFFEGTKMKCNFQFQFEETQNTTVDRTVSIQLDVMTFLKKPCEPNLHNRDQLKEHPIVKQLFVKFNSVSSSSAPAERLFSQAGNK